MERIPQIEIQVGNLATTVDSFIKDSEQHRKRIEQDQSAIWSAIRDQGIQLREFVDKLSTKGQMSWSGIVATGGFLVILVGGAAAIGNAVVNARFHSLEIQDQSTMRERATLIDATREVAAIRDKATNDRIDRLEKKP